MKSLTAILIYTATFFGMFFILSLVGTLWIDYEKVLADRTWFMLYTLFFGWWLALFPTIEYYNHNQEYFEKYL